MPSDGADGGKLRASLADFEPLLPAEALLLKACRTGSWCEIGLAVPKRRSNRNEIRASFIRCLVLSTGDYAPVSESGLRMTGAWITGAIELGGANCPRGISIENSRMEKFEAWSARLPWLNLVGCRVGQKKTDVALDCCDAHIAGTVYLNGGLYAKGTIYLNGATISGDLICDDSRFDTTLERKAINCERASIKGAVFLRGDFRANGAIYLASASIGGAVECSGTLTTSSDQAALVCERASIEGDLNLTGGFHARGWLNLIDARVRGALKLCGAKIEALTDSVALFADGIHVSGDTHLNVGFHSIGSVSLLGAALGGRLICDAGRIESLTGLYALNCEQADIKGSMFLRNGFHSTGIVCLVGTSIAGALECSGARLENKADGFALIADQASIRGSVFLNEGLHATGGISFAGATVAGVLYCDGARVEAPGLTALLLDDAAIAGPVSFRSGFSAEGSLSFVGAALGARLDCEGAQLNCPAGIALSLYNASISNDVFLNNGFASTGSVSFFGAVVGRTLDCTAGRFENSNELALDLYRAEVKGDLLLRGATALGQVRLQAARIGGSFECSASHFLLSEVALDGRWCRLGENLLFYDGTSAAGILNFAGAIIEGDLQFGRVESCDWLLTGTPQAQFGSIELDGAVIRGSLKLSRGVALGTRASFAECRVGRLADEAGSWSEGVELDLDGFAYDRFGGDAPTDAQARIAWLRKQPSSDLKDAFKPQPWEQCARTLRDSGHPNEAKAILIAKEKELRRAGKVARVMLPFHWLYDVFVGFGYKPQRLVLLITILWLISGTCYWIASNPRWQVLGPKEYLVEPNTGAPGFACARRRDEERLVGTNAPRVDYRTFSPFVYSLDHLIPVINFGHRSDWRIVVTSAGGEGCETLWSGQALRALAWFQVAFGWAAALMLGAAVGTLVKRD